MIQLIQRNLESSDIDECVLKQLLRSYLNVIFTENHQDKSGARQTDDHTDKYNHHFQVLQPNVTYFVFYPNKIAQ